MEQRRLIVQSLSDSLCLNEPLQPNWRWNLVRPLSDNGPTQNLAQHTCVLCLGLTSCKSISEKYSHGEDKNITIVLRKVLEVLSIPNPLPSQDSDFFLCGENGARLACPLGQVLIHAHQYQYHQCPCPQYKCQCLSTDTSADTCPLLNNNTNNCPCSASTSPSLIIHCSSTTSFS